ncbi:hypothetical protein [Micromonospora sp. RTP1Z1]|uniref:hypothetical protein n=1 Tax=Micromonospora sp. RTP1Z1 TaxID=2994043 RepID=UPI0029C84B88|nr:hypothetical protein [Micromonospora sp. RTP1Z1]
MLSFTAVHALSECLLAAHAEADLTGWGNPSTLLLIHDQPLDAVSPTYRRTMRSVEFPLHPDDRHIDPATLPDLLHRLAADLDQSGGAAVGYRATLDAIVTLIRRTTPDARLHAWAALYTDSGGDTSLVRRVDAVDTDGRLYQVTQARGEGQPLLATTDHPEPDSAPATWQGLAALLAATLRRTATSLPGSPAAGAASWPAGKEEPIFISWGPDGVSLRCRVCGAVDEFVQDEVPSMAGYGEDTYARCTRCGSVETSDPIFGWRAKPATWPGQPEGSAR